MWTSACCDGNAQGYGRRHGRSANVHRL